MVRYVTPPISIRLPLSRSDISTAGDPAFARTLHPLPPPNFVVFLSALNQTGSLLTGHTTVRRHDTQIFTACVVKHPEAIQKESITVILKSIACLEHFPETLISANKRHVLNT